MKKSFFRILVVLFAAVILVAALTACIDSSDEITYTRLDVMKNGAVVTEISFTEGEHIDYSQYMLLISQSDDTSFSATLSESAFDAKELLELYALSGGITRNMTIRYQNEGKSVQGMIDVSVLKPQVEVKTYTLRYLMEKDYASYLFNPVSGLTRITSLPESHPDLPIYDRIEWYRDLSDASTKIELPYEMKSDMTIYGKVVDTRRYTVRFWKDKEGDLYKNQIGNDVSSKKFLDTVVVPTENIDKVGYDFVEWKIGDTVLSLTGTAGNKYFYIRDVAGEYVSYPEVQIINVYAVYSVKNYNVSFGYRDENGALQSFDSSTPYGAVYKVKHNSNLSIGSAFYADDVSLTITAPPLALGEGYKGTWYINDIIFGENQTRSVQENLFLYAKYEKLKCGVIFQKYDGTEINSLQVDYGSVLSDADFPVHTSAIGYEFSWSGMDFDLNSPVVSDVVIREVRTALTYSHEYYLNDSQRKLFSEDWKFDEKFMLWNDAEIESNLDNLYKSYYSYNWYGSETANPDTETPLSLEQTQSAGTMKFYLKTKDLRRYTVNFYTQKDGETVSAVPASTAVVGYAARASFDTVNHYFVGWKPAGLFAKDKFETISRDTSFVPSDYLSGEEKEYSIDVVVKYERETYTLELYEPIFGGSGNVLFNTVDGVPYETSLATISELTNYDTKDRTVVVNQVSETFRFYGWSDESGALVDLSRLVMKSATKLYAKWVALSEGTYGIEYALRDAENGSKFAEVIGYDGDTSELIIGSKYVVGGETYAVTAIGIIIIEGKNEAVAKITIPSSVERIAPGAFQDFYAVSEYEAAADSQNFMSSDGVLYTKSGDRIIAYPCRKAGKFTVPKEVTSIAESAFLGYSGGSVEFPQDSLLKNLGKSAFAYAEGLTEIVLPNDLVSIESGAFSGCIQLKTVTYQGSTLKKVGDKAFEGTPFMENAQDGALMLGNVLLRFVGTISDDYVLDDNVTVIADGAFESAAMKTFTIGVNSKLTFIGGGAFKNCTNLLYFDVQKSGALIEFDKTHYAFEGISFVGFEIYVPADQLEEYETEYLGTDYGEDFSVK